jgi:hypothetical protein
LDLSRSLASRLCSGLTYRKIKNRFPDKWTDEQKGFVFWKWNIMKMKKRFSRSLKVALRANWSLEEI